VAKTLNNKPKRGPGRIRGVDRATYLVLNRMVANGEATWDELERKKIVFPAGARSDYRRAVLKALKKQ